MEETNKKDAIITRTLILNSDSSPAVDSRDEYDLLVLLEIPSK